MNPALAALLAGATFIALSPIFVREALAAGVGPTAAAFWRVALAVPILWIVYGLNSRRRAHLYPGKSFLLLAAALAFAGDLAFWHKSVQLTSVANATLLANLASIFVTLAAWIFLRQRPTLTFLAGLGAALVGVALLVHTSLAFSSTGLVGAARGVVTDGRGAALVGVALLVHTSLAFSSTGLVGDAAGVVTAMFYAGYLLAVKGLRDRGENTLHLMEIGRAHV